MKRRPTRPSTHSCNVTLRIGHSRENMFLRITCRRQSLPMKMICVAKSSRREMFGSMFTRQRFSFRYVVMISLFMFKLQPSAIGNLSMDSRLFIDVAVNCPA